MKTLQIYGQFHNYLSFSNVSRAFCRFFAKRGQHYNIWSTTGLEKVPYVDVPGQPALNSLADVGVYFGYPTTAVGWLKGHPTKVIVTVCETDRIPNEWAGSCNDADLIIVPSTYVANVFRASGIHKPIHVVPHGTPRLKIRTKAPKELSFLHVSGSVSFPARKGTSQVLLAWKSFIRDYPDAKLTLRMEPTSGLTEAINQLDLNSSVVIDPAGQGFMHPEYLLKYTAVIQPSRAEGFGMVPLEARCQGVPAILTNVTGHTEHYMSACDTEILTGPSSFLQTQGNDCGHAPTLKTQAVLEGLHRFMQDDCIQLKTQAWANTFAKQWQWDTVLQPLRKIVVPLLKGKRASVFGELLGLRGMNS